MRNRSDRLRILWLSHLVPYPPKGGVLMRSYYLLRELSRYHDIDLIAFNQPRLMISYFNSIEEGLDSCRIALQKHVGQQYYLQIPSEKSRVRRLLSILESVLSSEPYTAKWLESKIALNLIDRVLSQNEYDIVHYDTISLVRYLPNSKRFAAILDHHNIESHMMKRRARRETNLLKKCFLSLEAQKLEQYEALACKRFEGHIVCSSTDKQRLEKLTGQENIKVIPNGIPIPKDQPRRTLTSKPSLLFIGGLNWYPNRDAIHYFLEQIWPKLSSIHGELTVTIIGKSPSKYIQEQARVDDRIRVLGFVDEIEPYYQSSWVYICPIRDGGGTKLKLIEAMSRRIPIIANSTACEGLDLENGVSALIADTPDGFCSAVCAMIEDRESASKMAQNAYEMVKTCYDVEVIGKNLSDFYKSIFHEKD